MALDRVAWASLAVITLLVPANCVPVTHEVRGTMSSKGNWYPVPCGTPPDCNGLVGISNMSSWTCYCQAVPKGKRLREQFRAACTKGGWYTTNVLTCPEIRHSCVQEPVLPRGYLLEQLPNGDLNYTCWSGSVSRPFGKSMLSTCFRGKWTRDPLPICDRIECSPAKTTSPLTPLPLPMPLMSLHSDMAQQGRVRDANTVERLIDHLVLDNTLRNPSGNQQQQQQPPPDESAVRQRDHKCAKCLRIYQGSCGPAPCRVNEMVIDVGQYADLYCGVDKNWQFSGRARCDGDRWMDVPPECKRDQRYGQITIIS